MLTMPLHNLPEPWSLDPIAGTTRVGSGKRVRPRLDYDDVIDYDDEECGFAENDYFEEHGEDE